MKKTSLGQGYLTKTSLAIYPDHDPYKEKYIYRHQELQPPYSLVIKEKSDISAGLSSGAPLNAQSYNMSISRYKYLSG
jgi:hypothetical protein